MSEKELMTPENKLWEEFRKRLAGQEGCNFRKNEEEEIIWDCSGETDKPLARAILETYDSIDVESSLEYFSNHGGHCDCEVLFNVDY